MSTERTLSLRSEDTAQTERIAEQIGSLCRGGEVIELISDLGGGKTAFVRGLARGIGSSDDVSSPSFTINNSYQGPLNIEHFDFYRLSEAGVIADELREKLGQPKTVVAVEWGDIVHDVLPDRRVVCRIVNIGQDVRELEFCYPAEQDYLFEGVAS